MVIRAKLLGHRDGEASADAGAEAHHQKADGASGADGGQGRAAQRFSNDGGIHHIVELLEQVPK